MAKTLKKLISLLAVLALLMTLVPAALAEEEEATTGDIAALTLEQIVGHQPANMITDKLTLSTDYTWTAEPTGVIDTETGAITRHYVNDTAVTLTATDTDGTSEAFALTVKAKTTKIYAADNFAYDYDETADALLKDDFIFEHLDSNGESNTVHVVKGDDGDSYLHDDMTFQTLNYSGKENYSSRACWNAADTQKDALNSEDVVYIEFDMNYTAGANPYFGFEAVYSSGKSDGLVGTNSNASFRVGGVWGTQVSTLTYGAWTHVTVKLDMNSKLVSAKIGSSDWKQYGTALTYFTDDVTVTGFRFLPGMMSADCGTALIDDFVIYSETADNLTDEEKAEYIDSELKIENITSEKASALTANLTLPTAGGLVTWTSSDESLITSTGTITRSKELDATVKSAVLTATYDGGSKVYNFAVAPAYYAKLADTQPWLLDFEEGTAGAAIATTTVTDLNNKNAYLGLGIIEDTAPSMTYEYDANRGLVAKIVNDEGSKKFGYSGNAEYHPQRYATGFDLNVAQLGEGSLTVAFVGAVTHQKLVFTKNSVTVSVDTDTATYPITPDANGWIRVDIDNSWAARSQNIYINGTALTGTLKNMIYTSANTNNVGGAPLRTAVFTVDGAATVLIDNITAIGYNTSSRQNDIMVDAALKAAELYYGDRVLGADTALITTGPSALFGTAKDITDGFDKQTISGWTPATITYSGTAVTENVFSADKVGEYEITVTATASKANHYSRTASKTITVKGAPVVIAAGDTISVSGATEGGKLIVAQYDDSGKMTDAKIYTETDFSAGIAIPDGNYKAFFINTKLVPLSYTVEK